MKHRQCQEVGGGGARHAFEERVLRFVLDDDVLHLQWL